MIGMLCEICEDGYALHETGAWGGTISLVCDDCIGPNGGFTLAPRLSGTSLPPRRDLMLYTVAVVLSTFALPIVLVNAWPWWMISIHGVLLIKMWHDVIRLWRYWLRSP